MLWVYRHHNFVNSFSAGIDFRSQMLTFKDGPRVKMVIPANTKHLYEIYTASTNVFDVGPTLYRWYTNVLCLLCCVLHLERRLFSKRYQTEQVYERQLHDNPSCHLQINIDNITNVVVGKKNSQNFQTINLI